LPADKIEKKHKRH